MRSPGRRRPRSRAPTEAGREHGDRAERPFRGIRGARRPARARWRPPAPGIQRQWQRTLQRQRALERQRPRRCAPGRSRAAASRPQASAPALASCRRSSRGGGSALKLERLMSTVVLYIAGTGRSGSTVLANILGEVEGVFTAGEVRYLWQRGLREGRSAAAASLCASARSGAMSWPEPGSSTIPAASMASCRCCSAPAGSGICRRSSRAISGQASIPPARPRTRRIAQRWPASMQRWRRSPAAASSSTPRSSRRTPTSLQPHPASTSASCT